MPKAVSLPTMGQASYQDVNLDMEKTGSQSLSNTFEGQLTLCNFSVLLKVGEATRCCEAASVNQIWEKRTDPASIMA